MAMKVFRVMAVVVALGLAVHAPMTVWVGTQWPQVAEIVKLWKEALVLVMLAMAVAVVTYKKLWPVVVRDRLVQIAGGYALLHGMMALMVPTPAKALVAGLAIDLRMVAYMLVVYVAVKYWDRVLLEWLKKAVLAGAVVVVGFAVMQLWLPRDVLTGIGYSKATIAPYLTVDQNDNFVRINSTMRGPNPLGAYVAVALVGLVVWWRRSDGGRALALKRITGLGLLAALYMSHSRSAWGAAMLGVLAVAMYRTRKWWNGTRVMMAGMALAVVGVAVFALAPHNAFISTVILHEDPAEQGVVNSNDGHAQSLATGMARMASEPLGMGVGSTGSASLHTSQPIIIENAYLFIAHEVGWLGLGVFIVLYGYLLRELWRRRANAWALTWCVGGAALGIIGLLLPVWADDTVAMLWWGMAGGIIGTEYGKRTTNKKAKRTS